jgi:hypothetical protein
MAKAVKRSSPDRVPDFHGIQGGVLTVLSNLHQAALIDFERYSSGKNRRSRIAAARNNLNKRHPPCAGLLFEFKAERYAKLAFAYINEENTRPVTLDEFTAQLCAICSSASELLRVLRSLRGPSVDVVNAGLPASAPTLGQLQQHLDWLLDAAGVVQVPERVKDKHGPALQKAVRAISALAATDYSEITGKEPSRSAKRNNFTEFLDHIFSALSISKKAASFTQEACDDWEKARAREFSLETFLDSQFAKE